MTTTIYSIVIAMILATFVVSANPDAKRLHEDLMMTYNRYLRPVGNDSDILTLKLGLKLSQLIDVNLRYQIMTTIVWVEQEWTDYKLKWDPDEYGGITKIHVPADNIWLPDLLLYNNADGNYEVTIMTKPIVYNDGRVVWKPPAVYKSSCHIDVSYFPFDQQTCILKFGTWTWNGNYIDLRHVHQTNSNTTSASTTSSNQIDIGIDLSEFLLNVEWDVMAVPATRKEKSYICCSGAFSDITFNVTLRRKTLFYTVNLIIPCIAMSMLSILVFYLPSDSNEKISLSISIVVSVDVFLLCLIEIIPPTSFKVPLLGQYLLFMLFLVTLSVVSTIYVLNISFRTPSTHRMSRLQRYMFLDLLPRILRMRRPESEKNDEIKSTKLRTCTGKHRHPGHVERRKYRRTVQQPRTTYNLNSQNSGLRYRNNSGDGAHVNKTADDEGYNDDCGILSDVSMWAPTTSNDNQISGSAGRWRDQSSFESATSERHLGWFNKCRRIKEMHERTSGQQRHNQMSSPCVTPALNCNCVSRQESLREPFLRPSSSICCQAGQSLDRDFATRSHSCECRVAPNVSHTNVAPTLFVRPQVPFKQQTSINQDTTFDQTEEDCDCNESDEEEIYLCGCHPEEANAYLSLDFVAKRMENRQNYNQVEEDWRYVATVIDRLLLWIFSTMCIVGTAFILLQAPVLYDDSEPIDVKLSKVGKGHRAKMVW